MLIELVTLGKNLLDLLRGVQGVSRERAERAATYFEDIAATLKSGGDAVREIASLSVQLGSLQIAAENFRSSIDGLIPVADADRLARTLRDCLNAKAVMVEDAEIAADADARKKGAERLLTASGQFRAMASELRVRA